MNNNLLIDLKGICKIYKMNDLEIKAISNISLQIEKGEFVSVMGPSGSGKSTLLNIIGCLDKPTRGEYYLEGISVRELDKNELATIRLQKIGFVFQTFNLLGRLSALRNVELPLLYSGVRRDERRAWALHVLESVGLRDRVNHCPSKLSGGEQQRVAIARALVNNPSIILADEPTGNIDTKSAQEVMSIFKTLNKKGVTILLVTHNQEIARYGNRIITLKDGEIVFDSIK